MAAKKTKNNKKNADSEDRLSLLGILQGVFQGRIFLTLEFFKRYWLYIIAATVMMLMYQSDMAKLKELKTSLNNARTDYVDASSNYNSRILESQMKQRVDSMGIDLNISNQPPYELKSEN